MAVYALINKEVIPFICTHKKVSKEYLQEKTKYAFDKLEKWLDINDPSLPTINQAKKISSILHVPFAGLYMNTCDIKIKSIPPIKNFRTFDGIPSIDDSGLNIAICDVLLERDFLIEGKNELGLLSTTFSAPICQSNDPAEWARIIREHYSINIKDQYKCNSPRQFYLYIREKLEEHGIFVQCFTGVPVEIVRGFSIYEQNLPIIGINDADRPPAKAFSMIHELVHLIKRESSVCNIMFNAIASQKEEVFCNAVAGELLVPQNALQVVIKNGKYMTPYSIDDISAIAKKFSVSREVITRRLLDTGKIDGVEYETYFDEFSRELERDRENHRIARRAGIKTSFYTNVSRAAIDRTSPSVSQVLYYGYGEELYSKQDIARHLGIAHKHVDKFLMEVSKWNR